MDEELCKLFCEEYTRHLSDLNKRHNSALHLYKAELAQLEKEKSALVKSILNGVPGDLLKDDAVRIDGRMKELNRKLEGVTERPVLFEPGMAARYRKEVARLIDLLNSESHRSEASDLIRSMIEAIVLTPAEDRDGSIIDLVGDLAGILSLASERDSSSIADDLSDLNPDECEALVAGAGNRRILPALSAIA
ncbi:MULTISPECIES: hypothetical protein [unclassified Leisingera]|uniref:hypothetical protein n=1 Tax=unclassified Leisingera TaxID=2614906 RepID=UPI001FFDE056|nr:MULTISPECIES: hypothetical protein [unclassified Leisingera]